MPRRVGAAGLGIGMAVLAAGTTGAQAAVPACDPREPAHRPALVLRELASRIAPDRDIPFLVARAPRGATTAVYRGGASIATERPHEDNFLFEYHLQPEDHRDLGPGTVNWVRMRRDEAPATVRLSYVQQTATGRCRVTISRTVTTVAPRPAQVRVRRATSGGRRELRLSVGAEGGCARGPAGRTTVRISGRGRSRTFRLADLCEQWDHRRVRLPGLEVIAHDRRIGPWPQLRLRATGPASSYRVRVRFRGRLLMDRTVRVSP
jgi:hypothetical protein